jgi:hypothetical protein
METITMTLCPACDACPVVVISREGVSIGEADNMVRLSHAEWSHLVGLARSGKLPTADQR